MNENGTTMLHRKQRDPNLAPLRLVIIVTVSVFVTETIVMIVLEMFEPTKWMETLLDSSVLSLVIFLILYVYMFRPLSRLVDIFQLNEERLKEYQNDLELMVQERSRDLEETSCRLKKENEEHIKAKLALFESEERFRQIFEQSEDAIVLFKLDAGTVIDINPTAEQIFRRNKRDVIAGGLQSLCQYGGDSQLASILRHIDRDNGLVCSKNSNVLSLRTMFEFFRFMARKSSCRGLKSSTRPSVTLLHVFAWRQRLARSRLD